MVFRNSYIVPIGVLVVAIIVIVTGYLIFEPDNNNKDLSNEENTSIIEPLEESKVEHEIKINVRNVELQPTAKPNFKVGQRFTYRTTSASMGESITSENTYRIEKIERINGSNYYVVTGDITQLPDPETGEILHVNITLVTYISEENGIIYKMIMNIEGAENITLDEKSASASGNGMYAPWMMALKEKLEWEQEINISVGGENMSGNERYKVLYVERIKDRDCFKVDVVSLLTLPGGTSQKIQYKQTLWIDVYERFLVISKTKVGNLATEDTELVYITG